MIRLTDGQWKRIRNHFPEENIPDGRPGRKPIFTRRILEAVLWIVNTGAQWHMLPQIYPNYKTVHRRFQTWCRDDVLRRVLTDVWLSYGVRPVLLRLANLPNFAFDRLSRYEAGLWRQVRQILFALDTLDRRKPHERIRRFLYSDKD
jgi:hypothetical protein